jgi:hypothetical protein
MKEFATYLLAIPRHVISMSSICTALFVIANTISLLCIARLLKGLAKEELRSRGALGSDSGGAVRAVFCRPSIRAIFRAFAHDRTPDQLTRYNDYITFAIYLIDPSVDDTL